MFYQNLQLNNLNIKNIKKMKPENVKFGEGEKNQGKSTVPQKHQPTQHQGWKSLLFVTQR